MRFLLLTLLIFSNVYAYVPEFLIERNKELTISDVQDRAFNKKDNGISNWGYSKNTYWFKFSEKELPQNLSIDRLEIKYPLEHVEYYAYKNGKYEKQLLGDKYKKDILYKNIILTLPEDRSKPLYFRVKSNTAIQFTYDFWNQNKLIGHINVTQFYFGLFFGVILLSILFSMITYFWLKDRTYLYMGIFLVLYGLFQMSMNRLAQQFIWPGNEFLNLKSIPILAGLTYGSFLVFMSSLLDVKRKQTGFVYSISTLAFISAVVTAAPFIASYRVSMFLAVIYMTFVSLFIFFVGFFKYRAATVKLDKKLAKFFMLSWTPFLVGIVTLVLKVLGAVPANLFTNYFLQVGSLLSIFMFIVLTGEKFKQLRVQKKKSDMEALNASAVKENILKNNSQIVHDINSPLSALEYYLNSISEYIPERQRKLGLNSFRRLEDIINNISTKKKKGFDNQSYLVSEVLQDIVSEKRYENHKSDVSLVLDNNANNHALFLKVNLSSFSRSISNILNNSYEANASVIQIDYAELDGMVQVKIIDNGKGIDKNIQEKIFEEGYTSGKANGTGIGLSYVKTFVEENNGSIFVDSSEYGTSVVLNLPLGNAPGWFNDSINLYDKRVVIIDDEASIYSLWAERLKEVGIKESDILFFSDPEVFRKWMLTGSSSNDVYLIDYQFIGSDINGLDLIDEFKLEKSSVLVTSQYANEKVLKTVKERNLSMIPKFCIQHTLLKLDKELVRPCVDLVLIDDDPLTRSLWEIDAEKSDINLISFEDLDSFYNFINTNKVNSKTPIYIDSRLGNVRGEVESKKIWNMGFKNLYITTGLADDFDKPVWIKEIVNKKPVSTSNI